MTNMKIFSRIYDRIYFFARPSNQPGFAEHMVEFEKRHRRAHPGCVRAMRELEEASPEKLLRRIRELERKVQSLTKET
jgi:hypothetical protein